jgi:hypothetical protein
MVPESQKPKLFSWSEEDLLEQPTSDCPCQSSYSDNEIKPEVHPVTEPSPFHWFAFFGFLCFTLMIFLVVLVKAYLKNH